MDKINGYKYPKIIAHRGNSSEAPENTSIAFKQAIRMGVDFIECDVQLTKDGIPVVVHDETFHRITRNHSRHHVKELDLEQIKCFDVGSWFHKKFAGQTILTLEEFLLIPRKNIGVMLEVKEETFPEFEFAQIIGDVIKSVSAKMRSTGPLIVGSLNPNLLLCLETYLPEQQLIPIVRSLDDLPDFKTTLANHYAIRYDLISKELVETLRNEGSEVWAWTVDDKPMAHELVEMGVEGIITNHPKKLKGK